MKISILYEAKDLFFTYELDGDQNIEDLKALIEIDTTIPFADQQLVYENRIIDDTKTINQNNISDGAMIRVINKKFALPNNINWASLLAGAQQGGINPQLNALRAEAEQIKRHYETNEKDLHYIMHQNPKFAEAVLNDDINVLIQYIKEAKEAKKKAELEKMKRMQQLNDDIFNPDNQKLIEEEIRMENVNKNLEYAQEHLPEVFASVTMLYIEMVVNKHPIQAFVDSGAQSTIMSKTLAERCGIMRMVDTRYAGIAVGVGTSKILGRVHAIDIQIGSAFFSCSLTILEDDKVDFLLGLDMLKRHQCCINLKKNVLEFHDGEIVVPFLSEGQIKKGFSFSAYKEQLKQQGMDEETIEKEIQKMKNAGQQDSKATVQKPTTQNPNPIATTTQPQTTGMNNPTGTNTQASAGGLESSIKKLTDLGFPRDLALQALKQCNGNEEMAASLLFSMNSDF